MEHTAGLGEGQDSTPRLHDPKPLLFSPHCTGFSPACTLRNGGLSLTVAVLGLPSHLGLLSRPLNTLPEQGMDGRKDISEKLSLIFRMTVGMTCKMV